MKRFIQIQSILLLLLIAAFFAILPKEGNAQVSDMWEHQHPRPKITSGDRK